MTRRTTVRCEKKHVAVVPFPFASHSMALAEHAVRLAAAAPNVRFSFINIPSTNVTIFHSNHHLIPTNLKVYDIISPPSGQNLEEKSEWYYTNAPHSYEAVIEAAEMEIGVPVSCLLTDFLAASASEIAAKMGVKWIAFWAASQLSLLAHVHTDTITDHLLSIGGGRFDPKSEIVKKKKIDFVPGLSMMRVEDLPVHIFESITGSTVPVVKVLAEIGTVLPKVDAVVINCFAEQNLIEPASVLRSNVKTLLQIGFPLTKWGQGLDDDINSDSDPSGCLSWLDQQSHRPKSVVYVSFGSVPWLSPEEISEIAVTLEKTETPYLWSLKDRSHLPTGFVERTSSYGKLVEWAPQTQVLSHPSVGAHIMHAGFNSIFESVIAEVPMIFRPIWADHMMNARMAEEVWQIGVGVEGRVITINGLIKCLEMVLAGEQGKWMRHKIKVLKAVIVDSSCSNGSATNDFNYLVDLISSK